MDYPGLGAYFLDKLGDGVWRLEVMPDAVPLRDPFERASLKKEVTTIRYATWPMRVNLPDLGSRFEVVAQNAGNSFAAPVSNGTFAIRPGTYLLKTGNAKLPAPLPDAGPGLREFYAPTPPPDNAEPIVVHAAYAGVSTCTFPWRLSSTCTDRDFIRTASATTTSGRFVKTLPETSG